MSPIKLLSPLRSKIQSRSKFITRVKPVSLILITVVVSLLTINITIVVPANANETDSEDNITCTIAVTVCLNDQLDYKNSEEPSNNEVVNQVNSTRLKNWIETLSSFHTRHTKSEYIDNVAYWLKGELQRICGGEVYFHNFTRIDQEKNYDLKNIICNHEGLAARNKNNDKIIMITAHYDSRAPGINQTDVRAPGADDNASGVAAILELARILSQNNLEKKLMFILFSGEEQ
jgi:hypothetical protein